MKRIVVIFGLGVMLSAAANTVAQDSPKAPQSTTPPMFPAGTAPAYTPPASFTPPAPGPVPGAQAGGNTNTIHAVDNFVPVTADMLLNPSPADWLMARGNYQGWGYSKLDKIDKKNVKTLQLVWSRQMEPGINEATPLIYKGIMYLPNPNDVIQAVDAVTGELLWQYRRRLPTLEQMHNNNWGQRKRSVFLWGDKIYTTTRDNFLVALDAKTGKELWQVNRGGDYYATNTAGPIVVNGVVIAGSSCQEAPFTCFVDAHDAETGKQLWHNDVVPLKPGDPGDETWANKPYAQRWITGVWGPMIYDPESDTLYYGSTGIGPSSDTQRNMPTTATLAGSDTRWAVNPKSGAVMWKRQFLPDDNWDQDCTFEMMPITTAVHPDPTASGMMAVGPGAASAKRKTLTGMPCKTGIAWSLDAKTGDFLWAKQTIPQTLIGHIDNTGQVFVNDDKKLLDYTKQYHVCPAPSGGRNWTYSAYSPKTNLIYVQMQQVCADLRVRKENIPSPPNNAYNFAGEQSIADGKTNVGRIDAISVETGKTAWSWETPISNYSPILATASGLLFNGGQDRYFRAFDDTNGKVLWQTRLGSQVSGTPVTFSVNNRQYVAIAAGGGWNGGAMRLTPQADGPTGENMIYVFALPEK